MHSTVLQAEMDNLQSTLVYVRHSLFGTFLRNHNVLLLATSLRGVPTKKVIVGLVIVGSVCTCKVSLLLSMLMFDVRFSVLFLFLAWLTSIWCFQHVICHMKVLPEMAGARIWSSEKTSYLAVLLSSAMIAHVTLAPFFKPSIPLQLVLFYQLPSL